MASLKNELSWSRTRATSLAVCRRRYWFQYYLKWNGWEWNASDEKKLAYRLSQMTNLAMLAGSAAHIAIKALLESVRDGQPLACAAEEIAAQHMNRVWQGARQRAWLQRPKQQPPLFELYYSEGPPREALAHFGDLARACVRNFECSPLFARFCRTDPATWLAIDDGPQFDDPNALAIDGARVWALPDFALRDGDTCVIFDWKTGVQKPEDELQILSYALHARDRWGFAPEKIRGIAVHLAVAPCVEREIPVTRAALDAVTARIRADLATMRELAQHAERADAFALAADTRVCGECFFLEMCPAFRRVPVHLA